MSAGTDTPGERTAGVTSRRWRRQEIKVNRDDLFNDYIYIYIWRMCRQFVLHERLWKCFGCSKNVSRWIFIVRVRVIFFHSRIDFEYLIILFVRAILINFGIWECGEYSKNTFHVFLLQRRIFWDFDLKGQRILAWSLPGYDIWAAKLKISRDISGKTNQSVERYNKKRLFLKYWLLLIKHPNRQWAISRMNSRIFQRYFPLRYSGDFSNKIS